MPTIVKKGTNPSVFNLRNGKKIRLDVSPVLNVISDDDFSVLMKEYGNFINERRIDDKNPDGCFIIHDNKADATAHDAEIGEEIKDNSAPIEVPAPVEAAEENKGKRKGKEK